MTFAQRLADTRALAGDLSARELGRLSGVAEAYVAMIERGDRKSVSLRAAGAFAEVLGVSLDYLFSGAGDEPTEHQVKTAVAMARSRHQQATGTDGR